MQIINPLDNIYSDLIEPISEVFNNDHLIRKRIELECDYFEFLIKMLSLSDDYYTPLDPFQLAEIHSIRTGAVDMKLFEAFHEETKHEIKAVEYYIKEMFKRKNVPYSEMIHFGLTSQDIVDPVYTMLIKEMSSIVIKKVRKVMVTITGFIKDSKDTPMMSRTHGQSATPTTIGKEFLIYAARLIAEAEELICHLDNMNIKFGGAVGNLSVHYYHYPKVDWNGKMNKFIEDKYGLKRNTLTTQVNNNDDKSKVFHSFIRINNILLDLSQDIWLYFSYGYLKSHRTKGYVGSSTMAHKNNPIEFENAMGNLEMVNSDLGYIASKLQISRLQRDLSDSTVQKNYGVIFSRLLLSYTKINSGIDKLIPCQEAMLKDILDNFQCYSEFIQTHIKVTEHQDNYEKIKHLLISKSCTHNELIEIFAEENIDISDIVDKIMDADYYIGYDFEEEFNDTIERIYSLFEKKDT